MTIKEMLKKSKVIYAYVMINDHDGIYVEVKKKELLITLDQDVTPAPEMHKFDLNGQNVLWIN